MILNLVVDFQYNISYSYLSNEVIPTNQGLIPTNAEGVLLILGITEKLSNHIIEGLLRFNELSGCLLACTNDL